ncbi:MAG: radical SAM protein [Alphaproteobacteria bacterium]
MAAFMHWIPSLAGYFWQTRIRRRRLPLIASFKLTYRCNLACAACPFHLRAEQPDAHIGWDAAVRCLDELQARGCRFVVFEGGEPLLWRDGEHNFTDLASYARDRFLRVAATTNGTLPLDVPTDLLWVSLDGGPATHDRLRCDSFDQLWQNLRAAHHPKLLVHFTISKDNWPEMEEVLRLIKQAPAVRGMTVQLFYPYDEGEKPLALTPEQRRAAIENVIHLKKAEYPILNSTSRLRAMIENKWTCHDWSLINVDPDGAITQGCYVKSRGEVRCADCGFTPVAEASGALDLRPGSIFSGWRVFLAR